MSDFRDPWYDDFVRRLDRAQELDDLEDEPVSFPLRPRVQQIEPAKRTKKRRPRESAN